jgi:hypothetical protein
LINHAGRLRVWSLINNVHKSRYKDCVVQNPDIYVRSRLYSLSHKYELLPAAKNVFFFNIQTFRRVRMLFTYFILKSWCHVQDWNGDVVLSLMNL